MITVELTPEEVKLLYTFLCNRHTELEVTILSKDELAPDIQEISNKMEVIENFRIKLMNEIKKISDESSVFEEKYKMIDIHPDFANILAKHNLKGKRKRTRW